MNVIVRHEACPECRKRGNDQAGDNVGVYSDGHKYCFSCSWYSPPSILELLKEEERPKETPLDFPRDYSRYLPQCASWWLNKYQIITAEIAEHKFGWSEERQMLIMPIFGEDNVVIMWQGRNFGKSGPKYLTKGPASDIMHIIADSSLTNSTDCDMIIVTEGLLDAIKVGRAHNSMPLWGSSMPLKTIKRLSDRFLRLGIWLDPDKRVEAVRMAVRASQYVSTFVVFAEADPKEYNSILIQDIIKQHQGKTY